MDNLWLFVVLGAAVVLVALLVFLVPTVRGGLGRLSSDDEANDRTGPARTGSLVRGFGYLYVAPSYIRSQRTVGSRMARAIARVDAVDPEAAPRRIGAAMMKAGLSDPLTWPPRPSESDPRWTSPYRDQPPGAM